jgi:Transmembrane secretion effector
VRRRDGASEWGIFYDAQDGDRYVEVFQVSSWAEHQRQHERQTIADQDLEQRLSSYVAGAPQVRHLIFAQAKE